MKLLDADLPTTAAERVLVVQNDTLIHDESTGDPDAVFSFLCMSKPLFALAAMNFMHTENSPDLSDEIRSFIPELGDQYTGLTFNHLLTHTTGIARDATPGKWTEDRYLNWISASGVDHARAPRYSVMTSWFLLARAVENASQLGRGEILCRFLSDPLNAKLSLGPFETDDHPTPIMHLRTGRPASELWWASDPDVAARAWMGSAIRGRAPELLRVVSALASRDARDKFPRSLQTAISILQKPVGGGLSTDGRGLNSFEFSKGAFVGSRWLGLPPDKDGVGFDSGTGSFFMANPRQSLAVVYLSNLSREPITSLARRRRMLSEIHRSIGESSKPSIASPGADSE